MFTQKCKVEYFLKKKIKIIAFIKKIAYNNIVLIVAFYARH